MTASASLPAPSPPGSTLSGAEPGRGHDTPAPNAQSPAGGKGSDGAAPAKLVRLRMYWQLLTRILDAHYGGHFIVSDADLSAEYLRVCLDAEGLLEDPLLADLRAAYERPVDSLQPGTDDSDWHHGIKQRCARFLREIERRAVMANADDGSLADHDLEYRGRVTGMLGRYLSAKRADEQACVDAAKGAAGAPGAASSGEPSIGDEGGRRRGGAVPTPSSGANGGPPAGGKPVRDIFLSYSHDDQADVALPLVRGLEERGVSVWWDHDGIRIGNKFPRKIREGMDKTKYGAAIISAGYLASGWCRTELSAMFRDGRQVFPILYGVSAADAKKVFPFISETLMREWMDPPEAIMDEIADEVKAGRAGRGAGSAPDPSGGSGCPGWKEPLDQASRGSVAGITKTIRGTTIERRDELDKVKEMLAKNGRVVVIGDKGSGKSALLRQVYEGIADSHNAAFVKADDFLGIESFDSLDRAIAPGHSFTDLIRGAAGDPKGAVVIVDSLDAIARDKGTMAAFKQLLKSAWGSGARTIVTVRSYDYRYSESINATDWGAEYNLGPLSDGQVADMMASLDNPRVSDELTPLLANPLNLYIFSLVVAGSGVEQADFTSIRHEIGLYDAHWHRYVEREPSPLKVADLLYAAARAMASGKTAAISHGRLGDEHALDLALSANVLRPVRHTGRVAFFHHAYMDYVLSRVILEEESGIVGFLGSDEHNMFVRPTLPLALAMARDRSVRGFTATVSKMLRSGLKHYWKMAAAAALARVDDGDAADYEGNGQLLAELPMLQRHFLAEAAGQENPFWLDAWGATFLKRWASDKKNPNGAFLAEYARAAAAASADPAAHARAFSLLRLIAENNPSGDARQRAVGLMAGVDAPDKAEWLASASESSDVRVRTGVARMMPGLLRSDPDSVPRMFAGLFAYEETSGEQTVLADAGSVRLTSSLAQDNAMIKWMLEKEFPAMLGERPDVMIRAAVRAAERVHAAADPASSAASLADAGPGTLEHALMPRRPTDAVIPSIRAHLEACDAGEFGRLAPLLAGSRLGAFRSMLVGEMARRGDDYLPELVDELSDPRAYELYSMQASVKGALGRIAERLAGEQASRILEAIMSSNRPEDALRSARRDEGLLRAQLLADTPGGMFTPEEVDNMLAALGSQVAPEDRAKSAKMRSGRARAQFLAAFPEGMLGGEHLELVKAHRPRAPAAAAAAGLPLDLSFGEMPSPDTAEQSPEEYIRAMIGKKQDREGKIALLESISEHLDGLRDAPDDGLLPRIEQCLLECARDADPGGDAPDAPDAPATHVVDHPSVRGLAALCLAKTVALRGGRDAEGALRTLSRDPSNIVRGNVARGLARLLPCRYDLAYPILLECSRDPDARVRFFLGDRLDVVLHRDPAQASAVLENVLAAGGPPMPRTVNFLLWLALEKEEPRASSLLDRVVDDGKTGGMRIEIPFALKPYLSSPEHQGAALDLLLRLIKAGPDDVRSRAAFFTFNGIDGGGGEDDGGRDHAKKVEAHLGLLASLFGSGQLDLQAAEYTVQFLETHWSGAPGAALSCLEAIARSGAGPAHQPVLAQSTARVISGMIERYAPGDGEWVRCLDILDAYATAGWPEVVELLAAMERPD